MTPITQWAGRICVVAATLIVSSELLRLIIGLVLGPDSATTLWHTLTYGLALGSMYALLLAVTALYTGHQQALGVLGLVGYLTASIGTVLVAGDWWFEAFAVPTIGMQAPEILTLPPAGSVFAGAMITVSLFVTGWITFGVAMFRSGAFTRTAAVLVVIGGGCSVLALSTPYQIPLAVAIGWVGYTLMRGPQHRLPATGTERPASTVTGRLPAQHPR
jgi:hypothetical protein